MKINLQKTNNLVSPAVEAYLEEHLMPLGKFLQHFEGKGEAELLLEVSRTTHHHKKGEVFFVAADLRLPGQVLRAEESAEDIHAAIDIVKDKLHAEIEKYRTKHLDRRRGEA